ncbi:MAG: hypothetical protein U9N59_05060 [Campylobacterota bacterium]|nr:hypothetical protein [Campylobacterota bacterium]
MSYNKFKFKDFSEFKTVQDLAIANGLKTQQEFDNFLKENYQHLKQS